ncbi:DUF4386 domain-containing protein [Cohnella nanjingensis]|uniref:DUF4386 domain-containing protein n=1 Tax=Cohnella nanjingensis TaxID=1387779 RepID=A0A7X0VGM4_9BACL|nr:DUF4386 domain-containing protein [Cohnella nanjingensis]MBB6671799.1 DUF4386 domain-containing protein [Cohnella nanjingensis]
MAIKANRRTAIHLGLLLICSFVFGIFSSVPVLERPDYFEQLPDLEKQVLIAAFFQAAMAVAYVAITVLFYSILKPHSERLVTGFVAFKMIGAGFLFLGIGFLPLLVEISQSAASATHVNEVIFERNVEWLRQGRDFVNHIGMILPWSIGSLILYYCLFINGWVPRWLAVWGIIGSACTLAATLILLANKITVTSPAYLLLNAPTAFCELVLALFLMIRGFHVYEKS